MDTSKYLTFAQFAEYAGCARQYVYEAVKKGIFSSVHMDGKKYIDITDQRVIDYVSNREKKPVGDMDEKQTKNSKPDKLTVIKPIRNNDSGEETSQDIPDFLKRIADSGELSLQEILNMSKSGVDKIKSYEMLKSIKQKREKDRRELVDRKLIKNIMARLYSIDKNEFLTLVDKIIPDVAGVMGCTDEVKMLESKKIVDEALWNVLKHIKHDIDKFLKSIKDKNDNDEIPD